MWTLTVLAQLSETLLGLPSELVVTSINDSKHMMGSRHYTNEAVDVRSKSFQSQISKEKFRGAFEDALNRHPTDPNKFRVLFEDEGTDNEHFHAQVKKGAIFKP